MNLTKTIVFVLATLLILAGCKKDEITYPFTIEFDRFESENGIRAYEEQNDIAVEINADPYTQDADLDLSSIVHPDKIVITSENAATLYWGNNTSEAGVSKSGKKYEFTFQDDQDDYFTFEGKGDETELVFKGAINKAIDAGGAEVFLQSGVCNHAILANAGCNSLIGITDIYPGLIEEDEVLLVHYFELIYK